MHPIAAESFQYNSNHKVNLKTFENNEHNLSYTLKVIINMLLNKEYSPG